MKILFKGTYFLPRKANSRNPSGKIFSKWSNRGACSKSQTSETGDGRAKNNSDDDSRDEVITEGIYSKLYFKS